MILALSLFLGAFFDSLIGIGVFVPGEPVYMAAGYQLYQGQSVALMLALMGGWLGDQASFFIGVKYGRRGERFMLKWRPQLRRKVARCRYLLKHKGTIVMVSARLLGPVAWFMPFIAGTMAVKWSRFTLLSGIGLIVGAGQFVFWGYLLRAGFSYDDGVQFLARLTHWFDIMQ